MSCCPCLLTDASQIKTATKRPSILAISHKSTLGVANKSFQSTTKYNLFLWLNSRLQLLHDLLPRITRKHKQKQALNERNAKRDTAVLLQDGFYRNATNPGHTHPGRNYFYSWVVSTISTCPWTVLPRTSINALPSGYRRSTLLNLNICVAKYC